ncbi:iron chelate uptake ABC transporter family permease subunit [Thermoactinomyces vulgaris]|jgi:iron complex transport system permease protein|uniref:iron chelate uptake ABC transporter family permease subunit n=1 Tax=Thermoactinomyces vulgaris TaxID=2026 RepID=UPI00110762FE|nr:iron chelate uptake ABC transporter family permease subunit [Thermoactinomyces vulgaris]QCV54761.1 iron ABC transporter permease [Thermoactinomyces vulgaris]
MSHRVKLTSLGIFSALLIVIYLFIDLGSNWDYVLPRRGMKILAILLTGSAIALSTVIFQTITHNRILTPSIMGLDSLYVFIQTVVIFFLGSSTLTMMSNHFNFLVTVAGMILFAVLLYRVFFRKEKYNIYFLLLVGLIFGILFDSLSSFMQVLIDPNEFLIVQDKMFASFNNINTDLVWASCILILAVFLYFMRFFKYLDVISLGKDQAVNLGVDYNRIVRQLLIIVSVLISISTALVGPIMFLGLLVANLSYEMFRTYKHSYLILGAVLISFVALVGGQMAVERIFTFETTLSVIINFIGGIYFIYLLLKENRL